jgi:hypothetical protein
LSGGNVSFSGASASGAALWWRSLSSRGEDVPVFPGEVLLRDALDVAGGHGLDLLRSIEEVLIGAGALGSGEAFTDAGVAFEARVVRNLDLVFGACQLVFGHAFLHDLVDLGEEQRFELVGTMSRRRSGADGEESAVLHAARRRRGTRGDFLVENERSMKPA